MSTNYYLTNKQDEAIHTDFVNLIQAETTKLNTVLASFCEKHDLDKEEVEERIKTFKNILRYDVFIPQELHICLTTADELVWQGNEYYKDIDTFVGFYKKNSNIYTIRNDSEEEFTLSEFIKRIADFKVVRCNYYDFS